ncbi:MAG: DUF362 domain-containing protein [Bacteroidales bacterium]|jgi:hypothetical protein|nr:DUF362 domain-containing protein [Bacteroidales bacterium]
MYRRKFFKSLSAGSIGLLLPPMIKAAEPLAPLLRDDVPATNIAEARAIPRTRDSMPGKYPGKVIKTVRPGCVVDGKPDSDTVYDMLKSSMLRLTGVANLKDAWRQFVDTSDIIGLKVNPIAGKMLATSHALTQAVVRQLEEAGISRANMVIWDRREMQLAETGYTSENYPGIKITGTECEDANGGYYTPEGKLYGEERIDKDHYFYADVDGQYDAETIPFMINGGKYSYFSKICTRQVTKIINLPVLKNAGASVTLCMKNLAYGTLTNTGRLHEKLWHETSAYACAFPPLRDKAVLNIVDGLIGCFDGGPSANPQFICEYNTLLVGTDPVAVDCIGYGIVLAKRIEEGKQKEERPGSTRFMELAQELKLGVADRSKIELLEI